MDIATMIEVIQNHGYIALFLIFIIGLFFFPVPNEFLLMSGGWLATTYLVDPIPSFIIIYITVIFHGTILYLIGSYVSKKTRFSLHNKWYERAERGRELLERHGLKAASFSYFLPFLRHAVPFSVGVSTISYKKFAYFGFGSALIWVSIYFFLGYYYGRSITSWATFIEQLMYTVAGLIIVLITIRVLKRKKKRRQNQSHANAKSNS